VCVYVLVVFFRVGALRGPWDISFWLQCSVDDLLEVVSLGGAAGRGYGDYDLKRVILASGLPVVGSIRCPSSSASQDYGRRCTS
jgi:hypothetical protein